MLQRGQNNFTRVNGSVVQRAHKMRLKGQGTIPGVKVHHSKTFVRLGRHRQYEVLLHFPW